MDARNKQKITGRIDEVIEVASKYESLLKKLTNLHAKYTEMLEQDTYPDKCEVKKINATIKRVERSLRITGSKFKNSYERLIEEEFNELKVIKETLKKVELNND